MAANSGLAEQAGELVDARTRTRRRGGDDGRRTAWRCTTATSTRSSPCADAGRRRRRPGHVRPTRCRTPSCCATTCPSSSAGWPSPVPLPASPSPWCCGSGRSSSSPPSASWPSPSATLIIGLTRIAVDGRMLAVRQIARWQGPIDLGDLVAVGYAPAAVDAHVGTLAIRADRGRPALQPYGLPGHRPRTRRPAQAAQRPPCRDRLLQPRLPVAGLPAPPRAVSCRHRRHSSVQRPGRSSTTSTAAIWAAERPESGP